MKKLIKYFIIFSWFFLIPNQHVSIVGHFKHKEDCKYTRKWYKDQLDVYNMTKCMESDLYYDYSPKLIDKADKTKIQAEKE